jgi:glycosyltransferase involved in cell wall biosynthesis
VNATIIIPLKSGDPLLPTLQGLIAATPDDDYEVIFVDAGMDDQTAEALVQIDGDMQVIRAQPDDGIAAFVNLALRTSDNPFFVVVPLPMQFSPGWLQEITTTLQRSPVVSPPSRSSGFFALRSDVLRLRGGLDETVPESDVLDEYVKRLMGQDELSLRAKTFGIPGDALGSGVGDALSLIAAAATDEPFVGTLPESAAERLRERLWMEEERRLLLRTRNGRDVCWTDDGVAEPLVTVRIATYNRAEELMDVALPSALRQTYENLDIIVVGDHTDDATVRAMQSVQDPRVRFYNLPEQAIYPTDRYGHWLVHGSPAMNLGIELAAGSWIAPMDDDDAMTPDHVEALLREARARRLEFVWSQTLMEMPDGWQVLGSEPLGPGATTSGAVMWSAGLRFMKMSTTCWKLPEPHDQNMWRRMHQIGVKMGFVEHITYRYSPNVKASRKKEGQELRT